MERLQQTDYDAPSVLWIHCGKNQSLDPDADDMLKRLTILGGRTMTSKVEDAPPARAKMGWLLTVFAVGVAVGIFVSRVTDVEQLSLGTWFSFQTRTPNDVEQFRSVRADPDRWTVYVSLLAEEGFYRCGQPANRGRDRRAVRSHSQ